LHHLDSDYPRVGCLIVIRLVLYLLMNNTQRLHLLLQHLCEIDQLQPWTLEVDIDFSILQDLQDELNQVLNPEIKNSLFVDYELY